MRLHVQYDYPAPPDQVFTMLIDPEYVKAKAANAGDVDVVVDESGPAPDGFRFVSRRTVAVDVPAFAKKLLNPKNVLTQTDVWADPAADGSRTGTWQVATKGVPIAMSGTTTLSPTPTGGTVGVIDGEVTSSVPLVGGKFASYVAKEAEASLDRDHDFAVRWLKEHAS
ncbi:MAG TPA: DUF2505 domain-containing protein [Actinoplanes sp.]|nr:DUF2505 domain-containing protein [Actinoplanes sp.]